MNSEEIENARLMIGALVMIMVSLLFLKKMDRLIHLNVGLRMIAFVVKDIFGHVIEIRSMRMAISPTHSNFMDLLENHLPMELQT